MTHEEPAPVASHPRVGPRRLAGSAASVLAVLVVWLVARYGAGLSPSAPAFGANQRPTPIPLGFAAFVVVLAGAGAWATVAVIQRRARRPRRAWVLSGFTVLAISFAAPLSGHGVGAGDRVALLFMHLVAGTGLISVFASSLPRQVPASLRTAGPLTETAPGEMEGDSA